MFIVPQKMPSEKTKKQVPIPIFFLSVASTIDTAAKK